MKKIYRPSFYIISFLICMYACIKPDHVITTVQVNKEDVYKIKEWLGNQKNNATGNGILWVDSVINAIDWNKADATSFGKSEVLIAIPINDLIIQKRVPGKYLPFATRPTLNQLVLIKDKEGNIRLGDIVQLTKISFQNRLLRL